MQKKGMLQPPEPEVFMSLSAPISVLRGQARRLKRSQGIPLSQALDRIARREGYSSWSLLVAKQSRAKRTRVWDRLAPGELLLLGARRGQGKTLRALEIAVSALREGQRAWFFCLENDPLDLEALFRRAGASSSEFGNAFVFRQEDGLCAEQIVETVQDATPKSVLVIDYLQVLDQRRSSPILDEQLTRLRAFARATGCIVVLIAQIDRGFDPSARRLPTLDDVRRVNPIDLGVFDKVLFMHRGCCHLSSLAA